MLLTDIFLTNATFPSGRPVIDHHHELWLEKCFIIKLKQVAHFLESSVNNIFSYVSNRSVLSPRRRSSLYTTAVVSSNVTLMRQASEKYLQGDVTESRRYRAKYSILSYWTNECQKTLCKRISIYFWSTTPDSVAIHFLLAAVFCHICLKIVEVQQGNVDVYDREIQM